MLFIHSKKQQFPAWLRNQGYIRWKIENETINTLKNQSYHFEHNFGHVDKNLSSVFAQIMLLAFLHDQVREYTCNLYKSIKAKRVSRDRVWEHISKVDPIV